MSTSYYNILLPFSSVQIDDDENENEVHVRIRLFDSHPALVGELVFRRDRSDYRDFLRMILDPDPAAVRVGGRAGQGRLRSA